MISLMRQAGCHFCRDKKADMISPYASGCQQSPRAAASRPPTTSYRTGRPATLRPIESASANTSAACSRNAARHTPTPAQRAELMPARGRRHDYAASPTRAGASCFCRSRAGRGHFLAAGGAIRRRHAMPASPGCARRLAPRPHAFEHVGRLAPRPASMRSPKLPAVISRRADACSPARAPRDLR